MLWYQTYRPQTLDAFVWRDQQMRRTVEGWIADGILPHLLFAGVTGTGKTSLAELLFRQLAVDPGDLLEVNASRDRTVDVIKERVVNFVSTWPIGRIKYVLLDEADALSFMAQRLLRGEMDRFHDVSRFIFTCNYVHKIEPAIRGRCQEFIFEALERDDFTVRLGEVLIAEDVSYRDEDLLAYTQLAYPNLRKAISLLQKNTIDRTLLPPQPDDDGSCDYMQEVVALFRAGRYRAGRHLIVSRAPVEEYEEVYRFLYQHLDLFGASELSQDAALLVIRDGLLNHGRCADPEINLSACLCELTQIGEGR